MKQTIPTLTITLLLLFAGSCSKKDDSISSDPDKSTVTPQTDCSKPLHGGPMVEVTAPNGIKYCIDKERVTQAQFKEFTDTVNNDKAYLVERCTDIGYDRPYVPHIDADTCNKSEWKGDGSSPMTCADWCAAAACCQWAGKRLCGKVGGGSNPAPLSIINDGNDLVMDTSAAKDASKSQWYNACTQGGKTDYPYGDSPNDACYAWGQDAISCSGSIPPYDQISDLGTKGLGEWEDHCGDNNSGCAIHGSYWINGPGDGTCKDILGTSLPGLNEVAFRCCAD